MPRKDRVKNTAEPALLNSSVAPSPLSQSATPSTMKDSKQPTKRNLLSELSEEAVSSCSTSDSAPTPSENLSILASNFDDSSDEEEQDVDQYDLDEAWETFKTEADFWQMKESCGDESQVAFSFLTHFVGIQLLHSREVNKVYYQDKKKYLGGRPSEELPSNAQIRDWVQRSFEAAVSSFLSSFQIDEDAKLKIINFITSSSNIRKLFVAINRVDVNLKFKTSILSEALNAEKIIESEQSRNSSTSFQSTDAAKLEALPFDSFVLQLMQQKNIEPKKDLHELVLKNYEELVEKYIVSFDKKAKKIFLRDMLADNKLVLLESSAASPAALLFYYLFIRKLQKNLVLLRWLRPTLPDDFIFKIPNATAFFSNIRLSNRSIARESRNIIDREDAETAIRSINDWQQTMPSVLRRWSFQDSSTTTDRQDLQCKFNKISFVNDVRLLGRGNGIGRNTSYGELIVRITELGGDIAVAQNLRNYLNNIVGLNRERGKFKRAVKNEDKDFYADLTYLFFGLESTRNPAIFVINQMLLDLIIAGKKTWQQVIEIMPMVPAGAIPASRQLNRRYDAHMPHHYEYPGDEALPAGYTLNKLISAEAAIVGLWLREVAKRPDLLENSGNKMEQTRGVIMEKVKDWYVGLIPIVNVQTVLAETAVLKPH